MDNCVRYVFFAGGNVVAENKIKQRNTIVQSYDALCGELNRLTEENAKLSAENKRLQEELEWRLEND